MKNLQDKNSHTRLIVASTLFLLSIAASFAIAYTSQVGESYWMLIRPLSAGSEINSTNIALVKAKLNTKLSNYISESNNPIGLVTRRNLSAGELLSKVDLSQNLELLTSENVSIAVRASDIPTSISTGDVVTLYQVIDTRNGEQEIAPREIISGAFIYEVARKSSNFARDLTVTLSLDRAFVPTLLAATSKGRIVIAGSHG